MKKGLSVVILILCVGIVQANLIVVNPSFISVDSGEGFSVNVDLIPLNSDVYGIEFDVTFDSSLLSIGSVSEGDLFDSGIFDYDVGSGLIHSYIVNNGTFGNTENKTIITISFNALASGVSSLNFSNVIWVNSTITNDSVDTVVPQISGVEITINTVVSSDPPGGDDSSGGGGNSGGGKDYGFVINSSTNNSDTNSGLVNFEVNVTNNQTGQGIEGELIEEKGFLSLTGGAIQKFARGVFKSKSFYFILGILIIFIGIFYFHQNIINKCNGIRINYRKKHSKKRNISHY